MNSNTFSKNSKLCYYNVLISIISDCQSLHKQTCESWLEQPDQAAVLTEATYQDSHK
jgi:hypothetical protein